MTDTPAFSVPSQSVHKTPQARSRRTGRYRSELWFKLSGAAAILLASLALLALLWTVFSNAFGALRETYLTIPVKLDPEVLELKADETDPQTIRGGNFTGAVRAALREAIPSAKGRSNRRALYKLLSDGAALSLRSAAMADPALIGQTVQLPLIASDDVDLWIKGYVDRIEPLPSRGRATPQSAEEGVKVSIESNSFQTIVTTIKAALRENAQRLRAEMAAELRGARVYQRRVANAPSVVERTTLR